MTSSAREPFGGLRAHPAAWWTNRRRGLPRRAVGLLALLVAAALYLGPRLLDRDRVVTVDEPVFLGMSANFLDALAHGQFAQTNQFLYPAVPIMWAGAVGMLTTIPTYPRAHPAQIAPPVDPV